MLSFPVDHPQPMTFCAGDLRRGKLLYEWLADEDNRELVDAIERVNGHMLDQLISGSDSLAVLFCKYTGYLSVFDPLSLVLYTKKQQQHNTRYRSNGSLDEY